MAAEPHPLGERLYAPVRAALLRPELVARVRQDDEVVAEPLGELLELVVVAPRLASVARDVGDDDHLAAVLRQIVRLTVDVEAGEVVQARLVRAGGEGEKRGEDAGHHGARSTRARRRVVSSAARGVPGASARTNPGAARRDAPPTVSEKTFFPWRSKRACASSRARAAAVQYNDR